jgi:galactokinase
MSGPLGPSRLAAALVQNEPDTDPARIHFVRAPGRINLMGEHTDYNEGYVLPAAIDLEVRLALAPAGDRRVEVTLLATTERAGFDLDDIGPARGHWIDYIAGVAWSLAEAGLPIRGFRAVLASTLPISAGLSSSAALELAAAWALLDSRDPVARAADRITLARLAQRAENRYVGVQCGPMDQLASSLGERGTAMLIDCRTLEHRHIPLRLPGHQLVVCDSGSPRRLEASQYNARRAQCERAAAVIRAGEPGVASLRDVDLPMLDRFRDRLDATTVRRCEHVIRENERVHALVEALEAGDLPMVGRLFAESHASLRDLYEVSSPELDALVEIATSVPGAIAARMTGAGFGGSTVNIVRNDALATFRRVIGRDYQRRSGLKPRVLVVRSADGAGALT